MELLLQNRLDDKGDNFLENMYLWDMWHHEKCWHTEAEANEQYNALTSKTAKLKAVKNQILIRYLGLGWIEAYHAWSCNGVDYTPLHLFKFLVDVVMLLKYEKEVLDEPSVELLSPPGMPTLGKISSDAKGLSESHNDRIEAFKAKQGNERDSRMERGEGDTWSKMQNDAAPKVDKSLKGFKIEMVFSAHDDKVVPFANWYHGVVDEL